MEDELYYDRQGRPITMTEWGRLYARDRHLGDTHMGEIRVSTVWLGLDHRIGPGPPLIFETMVFRAGQDVECERYSTEAAALEGHWRWVAAYQPPN